MKKFDDRKEFLASLPHKRTGAGVLLFNKDNELLMVKTNYKHHWSIPGGASDDNESPRETAIRETKEEIGLKVSDIKLIMCTYLKREKYDDESVIFLFYGGILDDSEIDKIELEEEEIEDIKFVPPGKVKKFNKGLANKLKEMDFDVSDPQTLSYFEEYRE